jgi:hypothetical protein
MIYLDFILFRQTLSLTENLAIERENLVKELDTLKSGQHDFFYS